MTTWSNKSRASVKNPQTRKNFAHIFDMTHFDETSGWDGMVEKCLGAGVWDHFMGLPFNLDRFILDFNKRTGRC
jgi:hypothetical protein